ncbi:MAG: cytochrome-c peroxidase [Bacteroidetes bacterium]|nr:cytochrome-c peroxidase [Bacteroidota bacterium]
MKLFGFIFILIICLGCSDTSNQIIDDKCFDIPIGFPQPPYPSDNNITPQRVALGKRLFYDSILSVDKSLSCASCHCQEFAFADNIPTSFGVRNRAGTRNVPSLANVAYHPYFLREGGVPTLELQVQVPIEEHNEFDFNILLISERMNKDSSYIAQSQTAYNRNPDYYVITRAIACFERTLLSGNSRYDQYTFHGTLTALNAQEISGKELFYSERLGCGNCHSGFNFTNYAFENNGLYQFYKDSGRFRLTHNPKDSSLFKIPSLRNVAITAPYMHDGSIATLEQVIEHYNSGGKPNVHKSSLVKPLNLTIQEKEDLLSFLKSLTDEQFIQNKIFKP